MVKHVKVVGAGVSGLTTALVLAKTGQYKVTIVAEHMPGDSHPRYASPVAGANYLPVSTPGTANHEYERATWPVLYDLTANHPEAGIHFQFNYEYRRAKDVGTPSGDWMHELVKEDPWFKDFMPNFRPLTDNELPPGIDSGSRFTSLCMNTTLYLPWLATQCLKYGVTIRRETLKHIADAAKTASGHAGVDIVVNCTGLSSFDLPGVEDKGVYPARGQIVLVSNVPGKMMGTSGTDDSPEELTYIMSRAAGGGTVLGGAFSPHNWNCEVDMDLAARIMKRSVDLCPALVEKGQGVEGLNVIRHAVGLRPMREGGIRVEAETIQSPDGSSVKVVHNYGHGGYGYQTSYGAAEAVARLVKSSLAAK